MENKAEQTPSIIYIDSSLIIVDKPSGVLSIPDGYDATIPSLTQILTISYGRIWVVHRLDKDTSGVMVFARNADAHSYLNTQFYERKVTKIYHALISGHPDWDTKLVDKPLRANVGQRNRTVVNLMNGKKAISRFRVLEVFPEHTLLEVRPVTGRRHQIRAHLYELGFDIVSDPLYGSGDISPLIKRLALHAISLAFVHPKTGRMERFNVPYPRDFEQALSQLKGLNQAGRE